MSCVIGHLSVMWTTPQTVLLCRHRRGAGGVRADIFNLGFVIFPCPTHYRASSVKWWLMGRHALNYDPCDPSKKWPIWPKHWPIDPLPAPATVQSPQRSMCRICQVATMWTPMVTWAHGSDQRVGRHGACCKTYDGCKLPPGESYWVHELTIELHGPY